MEPTPQHERNAAERLRIPDLFEIVREGGGDVRLVDLRPREAFETRHLPGSCRLGTDEIGVAYMRPPRRRRMRLVLVADAPSIAEDAAGRLREAGYDAVALDAPVTAWTGPWESGPERAPVWEPSPLVAAWTDRLRPGGTACDLACGSGRDAVFLALRAEMRVTAIDILPDALAQGRRLAERHGVAVRFVRGDVDRDPGCWAGPWDLINVQRFLHRGSLPLMCDRLAEEGILLYETFLNRQAQAGPDRKPRNPAFLLKSGELRSAAETQGLQVVEYREGMNDGGDWTASLVALRVTNRREQGEERK